MAQASIKSLENKIQKRLDSMIANVKNPKAFLERVVYPTYLNAQRERWMTEGSSDGFGALPKWDELNSIYAKKKLTKYANFPGGGRKMMIATGALYTAAIGGTGVRKLVSDHSLIVGVDAEAMPYAKYANKARPFFIFSDEMLTGLKDKYKKFVSERQGG